ncbi:MAG: Gfo/Idh/MocA family oxidoreductase [Planctomycetes bacterium]|nr:Gfo/Idh/MocA family oxidoreductase [Planctomycetota bacterium]
MTPMKKIHSKKVYRAAVIGLGGMGQRADDAYYMTVIQPYAHANTYVAHPRTELVAGSDKMPDRREEFRKRHGLDAVYEDFREMLEKERPEIVSIAARQVDHASIVVPVAESGLVKAIYCEKPMAASLTEADAMLEACRRHHVVLQVNHQRRGDSVYRRWQKLIADGGIGTVHHLSMRWSRGRFCTAGTHYFDCANMFAGLQPEWAQAWFGNPVDADPGGLALFRYSNGVRLIADCTLDISHLFEFQVVGSKGKLVRYNCEGDWEWWTADERKESQGTWVRRQPPVDYPVQSPMLTMVDDLIDAIEAGREPPSSGDAARKALEMIIALHVSNRQDGARVRFPITDRQLRIESY